MPASTNFKRSLAIALAGGSLAIGVPAALAATGGGNAEPAPAATQDVQDGQQPARPDREDCPDKGPGAGEGEGQGGAGEPGAATRAPSL